MMDKPVSRLEFWESHPLPRHFQDYYDRLMHPHQDRNEQYVDEKQWAAVSEAVEKDYVRYLRRWSRAHTP